MNSTNPTGRSRFTPLQVLSRGYECSFICDKGLTKNRGFAEIGYRWQPHILTEIGYLNQFVNTANINRVNHILSLNLFLEF